MAEFTRAALRKIFEAAEIEVPKDVLGQLCDLHTEASEKLSESVKTLQSDLEKAEQERDAAKNQTAGDGAIKEKYEKVKKEFEDYKTAIATEKTEAQKKSAVRDLLKEAGISAKRIDSVLRVYDMSGVELGEDGKIKDAKDRVESVKKDWADFIESDGTKGANLGNPGDSSGSGNVDLGKLSMAEYIAARDKM